MKNNEKKVLFRIFTISDYDKEEEFLRSQHKNGYKFVRFGFPGFYHFEACEPKDVVYQLDFSGVNMSEKPSYLQIFKDAGWEYLFDVMGWSYFKKDAEAEDGDIPIFSDTESKIALISRIFRWRMIPLLIIFFTCILPQIYNNYDRLVADRTDIATPRGFLIFFCFAFLLYLYIFIRCGSGLIRLKKKYMNGEK
jgi:hypothetical protein